jgi:hypothetical protein
MLKSKKRIRQAARSWRVRKGAPRGGTTALAEAPKCCTCGGTLARMPRYLASASGSGDRFQCERCFYPETGPRPHGSGVVSSEETRRWTDISAWADLRAFKSEN